MTMHPYIGSQNGRERQREMMARAERPVARREIGAGGPIRENYLVTEFDTDDESRHVTEVCWPVSGTTPAP